MIVRERALANDDDNTLILMIGGMVIKTSMMMIMIIVMIIEIKYEIERASSSYPSFPNLKILRMKLSMMRMCICINNICIDR